ncbi:TonB-dependent receptor [Aurantiacibacter xanthus]|uniref:TonB-dependent receptor n=1 Tax=Aurantiacibacter xanthus TaxID=1784712 RepID=A0A3A1P0B4_9SPHN|nr:TonB-dependent receptor [Aurantiacibacter xanthus]RIV80119.1 TonB-dependent receptor [Aurantiacibacter xanthus]
MPRLRYLVPLLVVGAHAAQAEETTAGASLRAEREKVLDGSTIVVTASQFPQEIRQAPATMSVVTGEQLRRRPVQDLAEMLEDEPGVQINGVGMTRRGISIRGMSDEHVLTLVDGQRINDASANMAHVDFSLGWVPSIAIDRVEVVRGPLSALYGSEALAGVVNVMTRRPQDRIEASALAMQGFRDGAGGNSTQLAALLGGPVAEGLGVVAWGEYRRRDRTQSEEDPLLSELEARDALSGSVIAWWDVAAGHRIEIGQMASDDDRARDAVTTGRAPIYYAYQDHITRARTQARYNGAFNWGDVQLGAYRSVLERVNERDRDQTPTAPTKAIEAVVDGRVSVVPVAGNRLTFGAEHRNEKLEDVTINAAGQDSVDHDALFVQDEWEITKGATLTLGSRFDHHPAYGWEVSPRAYLVVEPVPGLTLRGGFGEAFKAATLKQLSPGYITVAAGGRFIITGNPDLKPETSTAYEVGALYHGENWNVGVTLFQNDLDNLVQTECVESCGIRGQERRTYLNVEAARIRGIEASAEVRPIEALTLSASYSYVDARNITEDEDLAERPDHTAKLRLAWEVGEATSVSLRGRYIGKQTVFANSAPVRLDAYSLWGLDASHAVTDRLTLKAGVDNIFNKRLADSSALYSLAEPGRVVFVGLGVAL